MSEVAIRVNNVSKLYKLYDKPMDRLKESLGLSRKKMYKEHYALKNVSFDVHRGETVGIIGTNGSGKSTMLKIITGVLNPSDGDVQIQGRISALLELGAGFNMEYTGIENIYLNGTMMGFSKEEIDKKMDDILSFADIGDFVYQPVKTYSSGMFVRLAFAVSINIEPDILIVDEALSVGDVFFQVKCYHKFEEFKKMGKTILFVSHDLGSISKYCDRVILLNKGEKISEGKPKEIVDEYKQILVKHDDMPLDVQSSTIEQRDDVVWKSKLKLNPSLIEYGEKQAEIIDFAIIDDKGDITSNIQKNTEFTIKMKVKFNKKMQEPIFAFTIKDLQGTEVTGTNTMYERIDTGTVEEGDIRVAEFKQVMNLQGRNYLLALGCVGFHNNRFNVYHRLYDVCNINVISDKNTVGFYDMNSEIKILTH
ncbi:ABC transporter ATP-binding protein [Roseburia sp. 831b]|uniref:ABC transporter ATP-binding protein n=1 Tax=Roseburia sp. 831b TaxID=1261635 RepID=UPI000951646C|nr:ABC transporter ATP-binding protein [Roseburia sp. 831b]WVK72008.1 ABC transporter ATP-binding protein [Roseburia sp. 831b]